MPAYLRRSGKASERRWYLRKFLKNERRKKKEGKRKEGKKGKDILSTENRKGIKKHRNFAKRQKG